MVHQPLYNPGWSKNRQVENLTFPFTVQTVFEHKHKVVDNSPNRQVLWNDNYPRHDLPR